MPTSPTSDRSTAGTPRRPTVRERLVEALLPWFLTGDRGVDALEIEDLLGEPEVAPLATQLGYLPEMTLLQRDRLEVDVRLAVRRARTAEALRVGAAAGVPARTALGVSLALSDAVGAAREVERRLASAAYEARAGGDAPAELELERLGALARELAAACAVLHESRALRAGPPAG